MTTIQHLSDRPTVNFHEVPCLLIWVGAGRTPHWLTIVDSERAMLLHGDVLVASGTYDACQAARRLCGEVYSA